MQATATRQGVEDAGQFRMQTALYTAPVQLTTSDRNPLIGMTKPQQDLTSQHEFVLLHKLAEDS